MISQNGHSAKQQQQSHPNYLLSLHILPKNIYFFNNPSLII